MVGGRFLLIHLLSITGVWAGMAEGKPFGLGVGPVFIGGQDTDIEGTQVALRILAQYINYKVLSGEATEMDVFEYRKYYAKNLCIGACPYHSHCDNGVCVCNQGYKQVYGQCRTKTSGANLAGDDAKYRKPTPPPIFQWCYCEERDRDGHRQRTICQDHKTNEMCQLPTYPNVFDDQRQFCNRGDHNFCLGKDINMFCSDDVDIVTQRRACGCRKEMKFDQQKMECRIHIGADCSGVNRTGYFNPHHLTEVLAGEEDAPEGVTYDKEDVLQGFCLLLDGQVDDYDAHLIGAGESLNWKLAPAVLAVNLLLLLF